MWVELSRNGTISLARWLRRLHSWNDTNKLPRYFLQYTTMSYSLNTMNAPLLSAVSPSIVYMMNRQSHRDSPGRGANASCLNHEPLGDSEDQRRPRNDGLDLHRAQ